MAETLFGLGRIIRSGGIYRVAPGMTEFMAQEHQELDRLLNELSDELRALPLVRNCRETCDRVRAICRDLSHLLHTQVWQEERALYPPLERRVQKISGSPDPMRNEEEDSGAEEKALLEGVEKLALNGRNRREVMQLGNTYIQWVRQRLLDETGRRAFPLLRRGVDRDTQKEIQHALEELSRETTARISDAPPDAEV